MLQGKKQQYKPSNETANWLFLVVHNLRMLQASEVAIISSNTSQQSIQWQWAIPNKNYGAVKMYSERVND